MGYCVCVFFSVLYEGIVSFSPLPPPHLLLVLDFDERTRLRLEPPSVLSSVWTTTAALTRFTIYPLSAALQLPHLTPHFKPDSVSCMAPS